MRIAVAVAVVGCGGDPVVVTASAGSAAPARVAAPPVMAMRPVETAWTVPGGTVKATVIDTGRASELVVWSGGTRHDVVTTRALCGSAELRHVRDLLVFRCETAAMADDWLIRWRPDRGYPSRKRHWRGGIADREPRWAGERCCCSRTLAEGEVVEVIDRAACSACLDEARCDAE